MQDEVIIPRQEVNSSIETIHSLKVTDPGPGLFTIQEASKYLRCSTVSFWKIRKEADLQPVYICKKPFFKKSDLDSYINRNDKSLKTAREIFELLGVPRFLLRRLEVEMIVKSYLIGDVVKYNLTEVYKALQELKKQEVVNG